jgi:hypothetical protein
MLTANWGRQGPSLVMGIVAGPEPTIDELELSTRLENALRCNYHGWFDGKCSDCSDPEELPPPPLSWLREVMARPKMWRNLHHVGRKGSAEIVEALERFDG